MHARLATINARFIFVHAMLLGVVYVALSMPLPAHAQGADTTGTGSQQQGEQSVVTATDDELQTTLSSNGIFGCLGRGAEVAIAGRSNPGTTRAVGGVYVPVNDAAVTLNTGFLVYKECILDGMARQIAQNYSSELGRQQVQAFNEGQNGQGTYLRNFDTLLQPYNVRITEQNVQAIQNGQMCGAFRGRVASAVARNVLYTMNGQASAATCSFTSDADRTAVTGGAVPINWGPQWTRLISGDYELAHYNREIEKNDAARAHFNENMRQMIVMSDGVVPVFDDYRNPLGMNVVTPGFLIANSIAQVTGSGYRQLEQANEIDQIVSNLWGGLSTRLLSSGGGVPGLFVSTGNQPAYIDRMVAETRSAVRAGAVNAAVVTLSSYRAAEGAYLDAKQGTGNAILSALSQIRAIERQCWDLIIPAVQAHAAANGNATLVIATSTQFSTAVIDSPANNLRALGTTTAAEIAASQQTLQQIDQLITQVTNSGSSAAQQQALLQIDQMVANNQLHSQQDAQNAVDQRTSITNALNTLINDTRTAWGDSTDPNVGWCNVNNTPTVERWFNAWKQ
ncbi:MAG: hypothetical protein WA021_04105 [Minisyncoccia bacterium]